MANKETIVKMNLITFSEINRDNSFFMEIPNTLNLTKYFLN